MGANGRKRPSLHSGVRQHLRFMKKCRCGFDNQDAEQACSECGSSLDSQFHPMPFATEKRQLTKREKIKSVTVLVLVTGLITLATIVIFGFLSGLSVGGW